MGIVLRQVRLEAVAVIEVRVQTGAQLMWFCETCGFAVEATVARAVDAVEHPHEVRYGVSEALLIGERFTYDPSVKYPYALRAVWVSDTVQLP